MFEPYVAKAIVQHQWTAGTLSIWLTFRFPMNQLVKPLDTVWLVKVDGVVKAVASSAWQDAFTMLLSVNSITTAPLIVAVKFDGPDSNLETTWHKNWEPWGYIVSSYVGFTNQPLNTTDTPTFAGLLTAGGIGGDGQNVGGLAAYDITVPFLHLDGATPRVVLDSTGSSSIVFANRNAAVNSKIILLLQSLTTIEFRIVNDALTLKKIPFSIALGDGKITVSEEFRSNVGFNVNGTSGYSGSFSILDGDGVTYHDFTYSGGILTSYGTS